MKKITTIILVSVAVILLVTVCIIFKVNKADKVTIPEETVVPQELPTSFRQPLADGAPHIVNAQVETIQIPGCSICSADIIQSMEGVSEDAIISINTSVTNGVFGEKDIRNPKNRILSKDVGSIDFLEAKILYIEKGIVSGRSSLEAYFKDTPHPARDPLSYYIFNTNSETSESIVFDADGSFSNKDKVLEHFYPNGEELFIDYKKVYDNPAESCYEGAMFPEDFWPSVRPNTQEVVYSVAFPWATIGPCSPGLQIAIPVKDIIEQTPEYIPENSILWKFK